MKRRQLNPTSFLECYTIHRKLENSDQTILRDKETNDYVLMKELMLTDSSELKKVVETLEAQKGLHHEHLLTLMDYFTAAEYVHEAGVQNKVVTFFEYSTHSVLQEVEARYAESRLFEEAEVWSILCSSVLGLAYLQKQNIGHGCVSPIDIFISGDGTVKIVDPSIATSSPFTLMQGYYYSPEIIQHFRDPDNFSTESVDIFKSDVFSLGLCVLHAALLESADDCFDYEQASIDLNALQNKMNLLSEHYSIELTNLLVSMLNYDAQQRPDFIELEDVLTSMTQSIHSTKNQKKSIVMSRIVTPASKPATLLEDDASPEISHQNGVPQTVELDYQVHDQSEDTGTKEQGIKQFIQANFPILNPNKQEANKSTMLSFGDISRNTHDIVKLSHNVSNTTIELSAPVTNDTASRATTSVPISVGKINQPIQQKTVLREVVQNRVPLQNTHIHATPVSDQQTAVRVAQIKPVSFEFTPDKPVVSQVTSTGIRAFNQQSTAKQEQRNIDTASRRPTGEIEVNAVSQIFNNSHPGKQNIQQAQQFTKAIPQTPSSQPYIQQQTLTRVLEVQQVIPQQNAQIIQRRVSEQGYIVQGQQAPQPLQQQPIQQNQTVTTSYISKASVNNHSVSPRNYLGYRHVGRDQYLFTDPALLAIMRQDVQKILSRSQLKNKENQPVK